MDIDVTLHAVLGTKPTHLAANTGTRFPHTGLASSTDADAPVVKGVPLTPIPPSSLTYSYRSIALRTGAIACYRVRLAARIAVRSSNAILHERSAKLSRVTGTAPHAGLAS